MTTIDNNRTWRQSKAAGHIGALLTVMCWGCSFIATKVLMEEGHLTPSEVYVYRFTIGYLVMLALTFREIRAKSLTDELQLALCGICSGTLYFLTENYALMYTTTGNVSLLSSISPIFTAILLSIIYKTKMKAGEITGSAVAFAGVGCVIFSESFAKGLGMEIHPLGDLLALTCAMSWAVYSIAIKRLIPLYSSLFITRKLFFYGVVTALPLLLFQPEPLHLHILFDFSQPKYLLNLLFLSLMCSVMAYILWNEAMKSLGSVTANNYLYLQPPVTMVAGWMLLGEEIYMLGYIGCALILIGLLVADKMHK